MTMVTMKTIIIMLNWNNEKNIVETSYVTSQFLLRPNAPNLIDAIIESIPESKFLHVAMDGPSTNWNVLEMIDNHLV